MLSILLREPKYRLQLHSIRRKRRTVKKTMRAIGLVLLSIAIMALLLTDADAQRRSSAQTAYSGDLRKSYLPTPWTIRNRQSLVPRFEVWWACPAFIW